MKSPPGIGWSHSHCYSWFLLSLLTVLVCPGCKNTIYWVDSTINIYHSQFWGWEVQNWDANRMIVWWGSASWFIFSLCPYMMEGKGSSLGVSFIKAPPLWPNHIPKPRSPNTSTLMVSISTYKFWGDKTVSVWYSHRYLFDIFQSQSHRERTPFP